MSEYENEKVLSILKEKLYPTNYSNMTEVLNFDAGWEKREEEAKKLRKLLGFPDRDMMMEW